MPPWVYIGDTCPMGLDIKALRQRVVHLRYLSPFERKLNRTLWAVTASALLYSLLQHVVLANVTELFEGGARIGDLLYDLAIAYVGAFLFYILVVRLPLVRDRRNVYQQLEPLIARVVMEADSLMSALHGAAGFDSHRENTLANVQESCAALTPETPTLHRLIPSSEDPVHPPVRDAMYNQMERARSVNRQIFDQSNFVSSDVIQYVSAIENCSYFSSLESTYPMWVSGFLETDDLSYFGRLIFEYLLRVDQLDVYRQQFLRKSMLPSESLSSWTDAGGALVPLKRFATPTD